MIEFAEEYLLSSKKNNAKKDQVRTSVMIAKSQEIPYMINYYFPFFLDQFMI